MYPKDFLFAAQYHDFLGTILDVFGTPDQTKKEAEQGMKETIKRAKQSIKLKGDMNLACPVQGSIFPELREKCAKELSKIDADFYPIGGVVPLMENQRYLDLVKCIIASKKFQAKYESTASGSSVSTIKLFPF